MTHYDIAVLGPANTFSDLAVKKYKPKARVYYAPTIAGVFDSLSKKKVREALVPLSNSLSGPVRDTVKGLKRHPEFRIRKTFALPIHLALAAGKGVKLGDIKTVYSHPQAFLQCRAFLKKHLPRAKCVPVKSTVAGLELAGAHKNAGTGVLAHAAAIGPAEAAKALGLNILKTRIEDDRGNLTTFALIVPIG